MFPVLATAHPSLPASGSPELHLLSKAFSSSTFHTHLALRALRREVRRPHCIGFPGCLASAEPAQLIPVWSYFCKQAVAHRESATLPRPFHACVLGSLGEWALSVRCRILCNCSILFPNEAPVAAHVTRGRLFCRPPEWPLCSHQS